MLLLRATPPILLALVLPALVLSAGLQAQTSQAAAEKAASLLVLDEPPKVTGVKVRVSNGDTIVVGNARYRLWGIDAPDKAQSCFRDGTIYPCGHDATKHLRRLIGTAHVYCTPRDTDGTNAVCGTCPLPLSDRVVRDPPAEACVPDLAAAMVRDGWAVAFDRYSRDYVDQEAEARAAHRGLWSGTFQMPWDWRAEHPRK